MFYIVLFSFGNSFRPFKKLPFNNAFMLFLYKFHFELTFIRWLLHEFLSLSCIQFLTCDPICHHMFMNAFLLFVSYWLLVGFYDINKTLKLIQMECRIYFCVRLSSPGASPFQQIVKLLKEWGRTVRQTRGGNCFDFNN